jgi:hypothetical protein
MDLSHLHITCNLNKLFIHFNRCIFSKLFIHFNRSLRLYSQTASLLYDSQTVHILNVSYIVYALAFSEHLIPCSPSLHTVCDRANPHLLIKRSLSVSVTSSTTRSLLCKLYPPHPTPCLTSSFTCSQPLTQRYYQAAGPALR